jgi:hypothetical protein
MYSVEYSKSASCLSTSQSSAERGGRLSAIVWSVLRIPSTRALGQSAEARLDMRWMRTLLFRMGMRDVGPAVVKVSLSYL